MPKLRCSRTSRIARPRNILIFCIVSYLFYYVCRSKTVTVRPKLHNILNTSYYSVPYTIYNDQCLYMKPKFVVLITSHFNNIKARNAIRRSYPKDLFKKHNALVLFTLGFPFAAANEYSLQRESAKYHDILQGSFIEAYRNLTYKHIMGLQWVISFCNSAEYVIKMDDDIIVNFAQVFSLIQKFKPVSNILGCVIEKMEPIRNLKNKWYVGKEEFEYDLYPNFVSGWLYVVSVESIEKLLFAHKHSSPFWIDDMYVTGILAKKSKIGHIDIRRYFRYDPEHVICCIENKGPCDFVAAPSGQNYDLNIKYNHHLWECHYKKECSFPKRGTCASNKTSFEYKKGLPYVEKVKM